MKTFVYGRSSGICEFGCQGIFDRGAVHLLETGRCVDEQGSPAYRNTGRGRCVTGIFISEDQYRPEMEGKRAPEVFERYGLDDDPLRLALLGDFQDVHDCLENFVSRATLIEALRNVAYEHGLNPWVLDDYET